MDRHPSHEQGERDLHDDKADAVNQHRILAPHPLDSRVDGVEVVELIAVQTQILLHAADIDRGVAELSRVFAQYARKTKIIINPSSLKISRRSAGGSSAEYH